MTCTCTTYGVCEPCNIQRQREYARTSPGPSIAAKAPAPASGVGGPVVRPVPVPLSHVSGGGAGTQPEGEE